MIRAILTDIEGTTSSISFVKDVLFPYARDRLPEYVRTHGAEGEVRSLLEQVGELAGKSLTDEEAVAQLLCWIDEDRKITPLKALQGLIWEEGYRKGDFHGHVYPDAVARLKEWKARGTRLFVYSSGSVHAQQLLFGYTEFGDLTPLFSDYFDTRVGAKQETDSYRKIAEQIGLSPNEILFLSDIAAELDAAREAGFSTCLLQREDGVLDPNHKSAKNFYDVDL